VNAPEKNQVPKRELIEGKNRDRGSVPKGGMNGAGGERTWGGGHRGSPYQAVINRDSLTWKWVAKKPKREREKGGVR